MQVQLRTKLSALVILLSALTSACTTIHDSKPSGVITRASNPLVIKQIEYAKDHFKSPNKEIFGDLGGTDCVNFTSQTLFARGWKLTSEWDYHNGYTAPWISSTAFRDYLVDSPQLATALGWSQRDQVQVGDVVQFDWDNSGDRDHTAVVSGISELNGAKELLLTSHSPAAFDWPISQAIAEHGNQTKVYFWHIL